MNKPGASNSISDFSNMPSNHNRIRGQGIKIHDVDISSDICSNVTDL